MRSGKGLCVCMCGLASIIHASCCARTCFAKCACRWEAAPQSAAHLWLLYAYAYEHLMGDGLALIMCVAPQCRSQGSCVIVKLCSRRSFCAGLTREHGWAVMRCGRLGFMRLSVLVYLYHTDLSLTFCANPTQKHGWEVMCSTRVCGCIAGVQASNDIPYLSAISWRLPEVHWTGVPRCWL